MSRHSKNNTAHSIFTYHERKMVKDSGSLKERLGSDSMQQLGQCWLCLRTAKEPVSTPDGYIYCRTCIILNLANQKEAQDIQKQLWKEQVNKKRKADEMKLLEKENEAVKRFVKSEVGIHSALAKNNSTTIGNSEKTTDIQIHKNISTDSKEIARYKNFWIKENTPLCTEAAITKPTKTLLCPISKKPLHVKDLIACKPEFETDDKEYSKWVCSISKRVLSHQDAVILKSTGQIMSKECFDKYVLGTETDKGTKIDEKDSIRLVTGGTGFCAHNKVQAEVYRAVMQ